MEPFPSVTYDVRYAVVVNNDFGKGGEQIPVWMRMVFRILQVAFVCVYALPFYRDINFASAYQEKEVEWQMSRTNSNGMEVLSARWMLLKQIVFLRASSVALTVFTENCHVFFSWNEGHSKYRAHFSPGFLSPITPVPFPPFSLLDQDRGANL